MKKLIICFFALSILCILGCRSRTYDDPVKTKEEFLYGIPGLETYISTQMKAHSVEAVSVAVTYGGSTIYAHAFEAEIEDTFQAASVSKVVASYGAMKLVEQGKLDLDTPLVSYIAAPYIPDLARGNKITLRMVLTHTSGLRNDAVGKDRTVIFEPGSAFNYSGCAFAYLTEVISQVTGQPFDSYMEKQIMAPLGMDNSVFSITANGVKSVGAAYSLVTTPTDLAKFFRELMNPAHIRLDLAKQMLTPSVRINEHYSWGLGIGLQTGHGDAVWHWGNNGDAGRAFVVVYKEGGTGIIVMTRGKNGDSLYRDIVRKAIGGASYGFEDALPPIR